MEIAQAIPYSPRDLFSRQIKKSSNPVDCFVDEFEELQFGALSSFGHYFDGPDLSTRFLNIESNLTKVCVHYIME